MEGTKTKRTIFIGGIGDDVDETVLVENFATFGDIIEVQIPLAPTNPTQQTETKHRGFAFVTFTSPADAQDAIDNMDMNELNGRVLKVNLARQTKAPTEGLGNRAIWESEDWLKEYAKPLNRSGGATLRAKVREGSNGAEVEGDKDEEENGIAMEE